MKGQTAMTTTTQYATYAVAICNEGAQKPERVYGPFRTKDEAEAQMDALKHTCAVKGWRKVVVFTRMCKESK